MFNENVKIPGEEDLRITKIEPLKVGGKEGPKHRITTEAKEVEGTREKAFFVSKEYHGKLKHLAYASVKGNDLLRDHGFPVPRKVICLENEGVAYVVMSDVTDGGRFQIWGYSDKMTPEQIEELKAMNLSADDVKDIAEKAKKYADQAAADDLMLLFMHYHVRKEVETGKIDLVFLDVDKRVYDHEVYDPTEKNPANLVWFIKVLKRYSGIIDEVHDRVTLPPTENATDAVVEEQHKVIGDKKFFYD